MSTIVTPAPPAIEVAGLRKSFAANEVLKGVDLVVVVESDPRGERLLALLRERGWTGWTRLEPAETKRPT